MGVDDYNGNFKPGTVAKDVKEFLIRFAFQRVSKPTIPKNYPAPAHVNVGYNLMRGAAQRKHFQLLFKCIVVVADLFPPKNARSASVALIQQSVYWSQYPHR